MTPAVFVANVNRLPHTFLLVLRETVNVDHWSLFWVVLAAVVAAALRRLSACGRGLLALLLRQLGIYLVSYVFSDWVPYTLHVESSLNRLRIRAVPLGLLVMVEAVRALAPTASSSGTPLSRAAALSR